MLVEDPITLSWPMHSHTTIACGEAEPLSFQACCAGTTGGQASRQEPGLVHPQEIQSVYSMRFVHRSSVLVEKIWSSIASRALRINDAMAVVVRVGWVLWAMRGNTSASSFDMMNSIASS
ncbi:hypothetical protein PAXRUDRAFT_830437 [Paxillus rubicundulus Ve08.2h10]|uniref:Uncharacterized protein n=1 Tax=Paxillus rubicundulus Ve08.2h10 TaxID=930991 RepID=A0A0D0DYV8_9AGAM|nr:hypothetical protein PAXRUDRAFT_830437 [Paxillus rubicundulus Ve08.2h10]